MNIVGIDLAWGDKKPDGVCLLRIDHDKANVEAFAYPRGDRELLAFLYQVLADSHRTFVTIDAPIVCPNRKGTRPVDRLTHRMFHREHAACHPANSSKCKRPPRLLRLLRKIGFEAGWDLQGKRRLVAEVYPHPAMVRLFKLERIVKYKKGTVVERRREFSRLQRLFTRSLKNEFSYLRLNRDAEDLLRQSWSKPVEDKLDALFCAMIGLWHWRHRGLRSQVIGDIRTGFILLPEDLRKREP